MQLPRKLKDMNVFQDGQSFLGECKSLVRPKLVLQTEDYRAGGLGGPVKLDLGIQALEAEHTYGGVIPAIQRSFGAARLDSVQLRFAGAYQREDTGRYDEVQIVMGGRHEELDAGTDAVGEDGEFKVKTAVVYYKETVNGEVILEVDILGRVLRVGGVDRWAEARSIIGG